MRLTTANALSTVLPCPPSNCIRLDRACSNVGASIVERHYVGPDKREFETAGLPTANSGLSTFGETAIEGSDGTRWALMSGRCCLRTLVFCASVFKSLDNGFGCGTKKDRQREHAAPMSNELEDASTDTLRDLGRFCSLVIVQCHIL